jgi:hypothetical protein
MGASDAVKDDIYTLTREAVNFVHEVLMLIIKGDTPNAETEDAPRDEHVPYISSRASCPSTFFQIGKECRWNLVRHWDAGKWIRFPRWPGWQDLHQHPQDHER